MRLVSLFVLATSFSAVASCAVAPGSEGDAVGQSRDDITASSSMSGPSAPGRENGAASEPGAGAQSYTADDRPRPPPFPYVPPPTNAGRGGGTPPPAPAPAPGTKGE